MHKLFAATAVVLLLSACESDTTGSEAFCEATRAIATAGESSEMPPEVNIAR